MKELDSADMDTNSPIMPPIRAIGISIKKPKRIIQLYSDLDDLSLKLAQFLKKLLIASWNEIISLGLAEPDVRLLFTDSKEKLIPLNSPILFVLGLELKCGSMKL